MREELDDVDLVILAYLQTDARVAISEIARAVDMTDNAVRYRIDRLKERGVIRGFTTILDPRPLGYREIAVVLLRVPTQTELEDVLAGIDEGEIPPVVNVRKTSRGYNRMVLVDIGEETDTGVEALLEALRRHVRIERSNVLTFHADEEEESDSGTPSEQGGSASGEANRASRVGLTVALPIPFPSTRG